MPYQLSPMTRNLNAWAASFTHVTREKPGRTRAAALSLAGGSCRQPGAARASGNLHGPGVCRGAGGKRLGPSSGSGFKFKFLRVPSPSHAAVTQPGCQWVTTASHCKVTVTVTVTITGGRTRAPGQDLKFQNFGWSGYRFWDLGFKYTV